MKHPWYMKTTGMKRTPLGLFYTIVLNKWWIRWRLLWLFLTRVHFTIRLGRTNEI